VQRFIIILFILCTLSLLGCVTQGQYGESIVTDTSSVSLKRGPNISHDAVYDDPLYYNNSAFDTLYFN